MSHPQPEPGDAYVMSRWWEVGKLLEALHVLEDTEGGFIFEDQGGRAWVPPCALSRRTNDKPRRSSLGHPAPMRFRLTANPAS